MYWISVYRWILLILYNCLSLKGLPTQSHRENTFYSRKLIKISAVALTTMKSTTFSWHLTWTVRFSVFILYEFQVIFSTGRTKVGKLTTAFDWQTTRKSRGWSLKTIGWIYTSWVTLARPTSSSTRLMPMATVTWLTPTCPWSTSSSMSTVSFTYSITALNTTESINQ